MFDTRSVTVKRHYFVHGLGLPTLLETRTIHVTSISSERDDRGLVTASKSVREDARPYRPYWEIKRNFLILITIVKGHSVLRSPGVLYGSWVSAARRHFERGSWFF